MIEIVRSGSHICIVDIGRRGYQKYGVPVSGAMDLISLARANSLLGNNMNCATLELYLPGHQLQFHCNTFIALSGATADLKLNEKKIYNGQVIKVNEGDILSVGAMQQGCRIYIAVAQGIDSTILLDSRSPLSGYTNNKINKGDKINIGATPNTLKKHAVSKANLINKAKKIRCTIGPEWRKLPKQKQEAILSNTYLINQQSDRMGYRLNGPSLDITPFQILSSPVMTGTVQLLPNGLPLILMRDCQTTGGYPRILQVNAFDLNQLAQRQPQDKVQFTLTLDFRC